MNPLRIVLTAVTATVVAVTTLVGAPGATASTRDASAALPTLAELRSARLRAADLPSDYRRDYSTASSGSSTSTSSDPECSKMLEALDGSDAAPAAPRKARIAFRLDHTFGPFVRSGVGAWRSMAPAVQGIDEVRALLRACDRWTETEADGSTAAVRLTRLPMPALGSERIAFRAKITVRQGTFAVTARVDFAVVRVRTAATFVTVVSFGNSDGVNLVDLTRLSTTRLKAVV